MRDVFFQILEYAGIPIGIMLFTIMGNKLSSADPISKNHHEGILGRGLELMQIICISTLLFGLSFFGHTNGKDIPNEKMLVIIISLGLTIFEIIIIMLVIINVREWGTDSSKTKRNTNLVALFFWVLLVLLISVSYPAVHSEHSNVKQEAIVDTTNSSTKAQSIEHGGPKNAGSTNENKPGIDNDSSPFIGKKMLVLISVFLILTTGGATVLLIRNSQKRRKRKILENYSKALLLSGTNNPTSAIEKLNTTLKKTPNDSALIIDIYMKLARIYQALGDDNNAIKLISNAQDTQAYKTFNYLRDGVLSYKADMLLRLQRLDEAESTIDMITSESTSSKLKLQLLSIQKAAKKAGQK